MRQPRYTSERLWLVLPTNGVTMSTTQIDARGNSPQAATPGHLPATSVARQALATGSTAERSATRRPAPAHPALHDLVDGWTWQPHPDEQPLPPSNPEPTSRNDQLIRAYAWARILIG
jgi:hypothetical protein